MSPASLRCLVAGLVLLTGGRALAAELQVVSTSPARHTTAPAGTAVTINFDRPLNTGSITASTFRVFGHRSGALPGTYTFSGGNLSATFTPIRPFSAGDVVFVNLSHAVTAADASALRSAGFAYQFDTQAEPAPRTFEQIAVMSNRSGSQTRIYGAMASDLNGDGYIDLTTVNEVSADLRVFMNLADGTGHYGSFLQPPFPIGVESSPNEPADFNGDGRVDACITSADEGKVFVVLGDGDGRFGSSQAVSVGTEPFGIAVLDADGDADTDVVNANINSSNLSLLINNGSGVFGMPTFLESGGAEERGLSAADMNNDGIFDLVVGAQASQQVIVMLGNGDGTFTALPPQNAGGLVWKLVTGDLNGDESMDVATANGDSDSGSILLGNGDGTVGMPEVVPTASHVVGSALGDLDGDGDLDWVLSSFGGRRWTVYTNDGTGTFSFDQEIIAPSNPSCAIAVDFDNDGRLDLVLTDEIADVVVLMRNTPPPSICQLAPAGTSCNDGNPCTAGEHCDGAGACVGGTCQVGTPCALACGFTKTCKQPQPGVCQCKL